MPLGQKLERGRFEVRQSVGTCRRRPERSARRKRRGGQTAGARLPCLAGQQPLCPFPPCTAQPVLSDCLLQSGVIANPLSPVRTVWVLISSNVCERLQSFCRALAGYRADSAGPSRWTTSKTSQTASSAQPYAGQPAYQAGKNQPGSKRPLSFCNVLEQSGQTDAEDSHANESQRADSAPRKRSLTA